MGAGAGGFDTELGFSGDRDADLDERSVSASLGYRISPRLSLRANAGAILGGTLSHAGREFDVEPGWLVAATAAYRWDAGRWFVTGTFSFGASFASTTEVGAGGQTADLGALDARVGAIAGTTLWDRVSPYALARGFGGPVSWTLDGEDLTGSDQHHYQLGAGAAVALPANASAQIDASVLGERSLSIGVAIAL